MEGKREKSETMFSKEDWLIIDTALQNVAASIRKIEAEEKANEKMSYNISTWKLRRLYLELPIAFDFQQWVKELPDSVGKRWCLQDSDARVCAYLATDTWTLSVSGQSLSGSIEGDKLIANSLEWREDGSGYTYSDILLPLFKAFKGTLEAVVVWEGGDTIMQLSIVDGEVSEIEIN